MTTKLEFIYDSKVFIDLYNILEIDIEAENEEIKNAYIKMAKKHHPDHGGNGDIFQQITKAYEILHNKEYRKEYDLYFLQKSMSEFQGENDDLFRLKMDHKNFVDVHTKQISKEKLDDLYNEVFKDIKIYKEERMDEETFKRRITDINLEHENINIETSNNKVLDLLNKINSTLETPISISDFYEYTKNIKGQNKKEIIIKELGTLDTLPEYNKNYTSFTSENEFYGTNLYSEIEADNIEITGSEEININDFSTWKRSQKVDKKLSEEEIEEYINRRKEEEIDIFNKLKSNIQVSSKKKEIEKFLNNKNIEEDMNEFYNK